MENENNEKQQNTQQQTNKTDHKTMAEKAVERFSEMMVSRLEEMKVNCFHIFITKENIKN